MARCTCRTGLEVHHKRRDGGNGLDNAEVLCHECHVNTATFGVHGKSPEPFPQSVKDLALKRAGNRCECTREVCGH